MKYTLNSKNASHISDMIMKFFKPDNNILFKSNYCDYETYLIPIESAVYSIDNEMLIEVYYCGSNKIKAQGFFMPQTQCLHIPFGSKIEMKGSLINISMKKPDYMCNEVLSFFRTNNLISTQRAKNFIEDINELISTISSLSKL